MTDSDKQRLIDILRHLVAGLEGVKRDIHMLGGNPTELELAVKGLQDAEYQLITEVAPQKSATNK